MSSDPFAEAFSSESPAHPWRAPVRRTLKSHRCGRRWSLVAGCPELPRAVSGCLVPAATFHVPVIGCFPPVLLERRAKRAPRRPKVVRGEWRLIATKRMNRNYARRRPVSSRYVRAVMFVLLEQTVLQPNVHKGRWVLRFD
jgi:hypothetical protein